MSRASERRRDLLEYLWHFQSSRWSERRWGRPVFRVLWALRVVRLEDER